ncbi:aldehyde-activating protein [Vibrio sp. LQ2]|uniref:GFA family protein n=1 Tax=Vibrio sp. LQ2 TaxID=2883075 RepID=UPI00208FE816|nr:aldehyde-activating protein [Vibrio sp. LQ2]USP07210.1 aldehyde-activating protein [Vibrio sp. LQ2]
MIRGHCHCGNISLEIPRLTTTATECNCSICRRYGALWGYFTQPEVKVIDQGAGLEQYVWGDQCIEFQRCKGCGCVTHYKAAPGTGSERLAVNYRMFDAVVQQALTIRHFDGADSWRYLD